VIKLEAWIQAVNLVTPIIEKFTIEKKSGSSNIFGNTGTITPVEQYIDHVIFVAEWLLDAEEEDKEEPLPNLGMATTHELLNEIAVRMDFEHAQKGLENCEEFAIHCRQMILQLSQDGQEVLNYRTIDS
jgi:hypothetical protein